MKYPNGNESFIPISTGQVVDPLTLAPEVADAIFGKPLMDELRKPRDLKINRYVQIVTQSKKSDA